MEFKKKFLFKFKVFFHKLFVHFNANTFILLFYHNHFSAVEFLSPLKKKKKKNFLWCFFGQIYTGANIASQLKFGGL